jgi:hypothetical protein
MILRYVTAPAVASFKKFRRSQQRICLSCECFRAADFKRTEYLSTNI